MFLEKLFNITKEDIYEKFRLKTLSIFGWKIIFSNYYSFNFYSLYFILLLFLN